MCMIKICIKTRGLALNVRGASGTMTIAGYTCSRPDDSRKILRRYVFSKIYKNKQQHNEVGEFREMLGCIK